MKKKELFYGGVGVVGLVLMVLAGVLGGRLPDVVTGAMTGIGAALLAVGVSLWKVCRMERTDPARWKQHMIQSRDERNLAIRYKAQALAGEVLQWLVLVAAWIARFMNAPLWVTLGCAGVFLFKSVMEVCLMARYQKQM